MLKKRIIANLIVKNGVVVQSIGFSKYLPVGKPDIAIEFLNKWGIDEIVLNDISASVQGKGPDYDMIRKASNKCFVPLTIGGGISKLEQIRELMQCGADKILLNQAAFHTPEFITQAATVYGNQCVVISIDSVETKNGYEVYDYLLKKSLGLKVDVYAQKVQKAGAGEILVNSVDRDGSYLGYDIDLLKKVCSVISIPVIACGGAKNGKHIIELFRETNVSAACASNFFHFVEHSVNITKACIKNEYDVRIETHADYAENNFDNYMRIIKKEDHLLKKMLYVKIEKEVI